MAYQSLEQPQRVKIAYQHYLEFFPEEPAAILGLISSVSEEQNLKEALELLDQYEAYLISAGCLQQLEQTYHSLDKIDPINIRVLEGLTRLADATGNESELTSLTSKLQSLRSASGPVQNTAPFSSEKPSGQALIPVLAPPETVHSDIAVDTVQPPEDEIEIEIDFDSPFGSPDQEIATAPLEDNWLDSVGDLFDSITTTPRGVKFGHELDSSDAQTHFDLGQAFKEMGLYDEAINEFRQASLDASRRVECLILQCACLRERGEVEKAITMLLALLKPGLSVTESCAVKYELATGYEAAGKAEEATILLNEINVANPGFRDIHSRLNAANHSDSLDFSDEDLKDFGFNSRTPRVDANYNRSIATTAADLLNISDLSKSAALMLTDINVFELTVSFRS